ncbi:MAG: DUF6484 domain-containing protein [Candidatus Methylumidiphilus sp.]
MKKMATESVVEFQAPATQGRIVKKIKAQGVAKPETRPMLPSVVIGRLVGFENGQARVDFPGNAVSAGIPAQSGVAIPAKAIGRELILAFADGDPEKPVILGLLVDSELDKALPSPLDIQVDGERLLVTAQSEIVLRCGEASVTLTRAGKVLIKGTYVLSRSSGYNKIKGAAIDIN